MQIVVIFKLNQSVTEPQIQVIAVVVNNEQIQPTRLIKRLNHA